MLRPQLLAAVAALFSASLAAQAYAQTPPSAPTTRPTQLTVGETVLAFGGPNDYAAFPALVRTEKQLILRFNNQPLDQLRTAKVKHPHFGPAIVPTWSVSNDWGKTWTSTNTPVPFEGKVLDAPTMAVMPDGGILSLHWGYKKGTHERPPFEQKIYRGTFDEASTATTRQPLFDKIFSHGICPLPDGSGFLAAAYNGASQPQTGVNILRADAKGENWEKIGFVPSTAPFYFNESSLQTFPDGRALLVIRPDFDKKVAAGAEPPPEANGNLNTRDGYGYYMYQAESLDGGKTWSEPKQLPIWGHPPYLLKLKSGNLLMVYGHRRPPHSVRAILSHDEGRTWNTKSMTVVHNFNPGLHDHGYPVATQLEDGRVLVTYYGYTTADTKIWDSPHGIFTTILTEVQPK